MKVGKQMKRMDPGLERASRTLVELYHKMNRYCDATESLKFILLILVHKQIYDDKLYGNIDFKEMTYVLDFSPSKYMKILDNISYYVNEYLEHLSHIGLILKTIDRFIFPFADIISDQEPGFILKNEEEKGIFADVIKEIHSFVKIERGLNYFMVLEDLMSHFFDYPCKSNEITPNRYIARLMDRQLNIKADDVILDGAIGTGYTVGLSAKLTMGYDDMLCYGAKIYGIDSNRVLCQIAALYHFLIRHRFKIGHGDFIKFADKNEQRYDKIAMEIPVGVKVQDMLDSDFYNKKQWLDVENVVELEWLYVLSASRLLSENGRAVLLVPGMLLHRNVKMGVALRKYLVESKCISKIISIYSGRREEYALIVLEKNSDSIYMVDTISNKEAFYINSAKSYSMTNEGLETLLNILATREEREGLASKVSFSQISDYIYELSPKKYIQIQENIQQESMESLYKRLLAYHERFSALKKEMEELPLFKNS